MKWNFKKLNSYFTYDNLKLSHFLSFVILGAIDFLFSISQPSVATHFFNSLRTAKVTEAQQTKDTDHMTDGRTNQIEEKIIICIKCNYYIFF
jgi:hypothetical protein